MDYKVQTNGNDPRTVRNRQCTYVPLTLIEQATATGRMQGEHLELSGLLELHYASAVNADSAAN